MKQGKLIKDIRGRFTLSNKVEAYIISVHIRNLMATYGEEDVLSVIAALFMPPSTAPKRKKTKVSGE
jgi:hypothetical protein